MIDATTRACISAFSSDAPISSRIARTEKVRVEFVRCTTQATLQWSIRRPEVSLMWARDRGTNARIMVAGQPADSGNPRRGNFWFFPEGVDAQGEFTSMGTYDCAGVFVGPSFLPAAVREHLAEPIVGFAHDALGRAFNALTGELAEPDGPLPMFTEGWAMQAFAYVARAARSPRPRRTASRGGLAPWQLRRATKILGAELSENPPLICVAKACRLSVSHFGRAFKRSTGVPPHQWITDARIEAARDLLTKSHTPLADVAGLCGFADQSHFSRVFRRIVGTSPGVWRREQIAA